MMLNYIILSLGQIVSFIGSQLSSFALGVWVYQRTKTATQFTLISFLFALADILFSPISGWVVDNYDRRRVMILNDIGAAFFAMILVGLLITQNLSFWNLGLIVSINGALGSLRGPAFTASTTLMLPKKHLIRANGILTMAFSMGGIVAPTLAGILINAMGINGVLIVDIFTFVFSIGTLLIVHIPNAAKLSNENYSDKMFLSLIGERLLGMKYVIQHRGLIILLIYFMIQSFITFTTLVLLVPMLLSLSDPKILGRILSAAAGGGILGGLVMAIWGPRKRMWAILGFGIFQEVLMVFTGSMVNPLFIGIGFFLFFLGAPIVAGCDTVIWQCKIPPEIQGRVFGARRIITMGSVPIGYLIAGPLADYIFEPMMMPNGALAGTVGKIIGVGKGRGIGLMFVLGGIILMIITTIAFFIPRLRNLEDEIPDVI